MSRGTNDYAHANDAVDWKPLDEAEACRFIAVILAMGLVQKPDTADYWLMDAVDYTPNIAKIMPRDRFLQIMRWLHFPDFVEDGGDGPLNGEQRRMRKIGFMMEYVSRAFAAAYNIGEHVSADEIMVKFTGRLSFVQYMPAKPTKWGIKIWALADPTTGYLYHTKVYTGKDATTDDWKAGLGGGAILSMMENTELLGKGHTVVADNFFTSPCLIYRLLDRRTNMVGTTRINRTGFPVAIVELPKKQKHARGDHRTAEVEVPLSDGSVGRIAAFGWYDNQAVYVLSSKHEADDLDSVQRWDTKQGGRISVTAPTAIVEYNQKMGGVDLADQLRTYAWRHFRSVKWWKCMFHFCVKQMCTNAFVIYRELAKRLGLKDAMDHGDFIRSLVEDLAKMDLDRLNRRGVPPPRERVSIPNRNSLTPSTKNKDDDEGRYEFVHPRPTEEEKEAAMFYAKGASEATRRKYHTEFLVARNKHAVKAEAEWGRVVYEQNPCFLCSKFDMNEAAFKWMAFQNGPRRDNNRTPRTYRLCEVCGRHFCEPCLHIFHVRTSSLKPIPIADPTYSIGK